MNRQNDRLWMRLDAIVGSLYPVPVRRFLTIRWMTVFVFLLFGVVLLEKLLIPIPEPPAFVLHWLRSPYFLVPSGAVVLPLMWFVIGAKPPRQYLYLRALIYGMLLAGLLGNFMVLLGMAKA